MGQTASSETGHVGMLQRDATDARDVLHAQSDVNPFNIPSRVLLEVDDEWAPADAAEVFEAAPFAASLAHTIQTRGAGGVTQPPEGEKTLRDAMRSVARGSVKACGATRIDGFRCERVARPHVRVLCELVAMGHVPVVGVAVHAGMVRINPSDAGKAFAIEHCTRSELGPVVSHEAAVVVGYDVCEGMLFMRMMSQPEVQVRVAMDAFQTGAGIVRDAWVFVRDLDPVGATVPDEERDARVARR